MKITRKQLLRLISEAMYDPMHGMKSLEEPYKSKIMSVLDDPDASEEDIKQFHQLGDAMSDYEDPRPGMSDDSFKGVNIQRVEFAQAGIESYLPGFTNLPDKIIDAVIEFVLLSGESTLHIELNDEMLENHLGQNAYNRATRYPYNQLPENAELVKTVMDYRLNPKNHDPKFYYIYAVHGPDSDADPFSRIDPYGTGDAQTGFHDGFREEYQKVTTDSVHKVDSYAVESAFIEMMRDLRPNHKEEVIN